MLGAACARSPGSWDADLQVAPRGVQQILALPRIYALLGRIAFVSEAETEFVCGIIAPSQFAPRSHAMIVMPAALAAPASKVMVAWQPCACAMRSIRQSAKSAPPLAKRRCACSTRSARSTGSRVLARHAALRLHGHARRAAGADRGRVHGLAHSGLRNDLFPEPRNRGSRARRRHAALARTALSRDEPQCRWHSGILQAAGQRGGRTGHAARGIRGA